MKSDIFIFDTNTLLSAFLFKNSNPRKAFERVVKKGSIFASLKTYAEFSEVILRPKFDKYISPEGKILFLKQFKELAIFTETSEIISECRDPKDNKFLELVLAAHASGIITGDKDLHVMHPFRGIPILNAADFLNTF